MDWLVKTIKCIISLLRIYSKSYFLFQTIRTRNKNNLKCLRGCITCLWYIGIVSLVKKILPTEGQKELFSVDPPVKMRAIVYVQNPSCRNLIPKGLFANIFVQRNAPFSVLPADQSTDLKHSPGV